MSQHSKGSRLKWEGYYDRHAFLDNGLHLRVTRIDPHNGEHFWMWTVDDPMIRTAIASSGTDYIKDLDEAEQQCVTAAKRCVPWGGRGA